MGRKVLVVVGVVLALGLIGQVAGRSAEEDEPPTTIPPDMFDFPEGEEIEVPEIEVPDFSLPELPEEPPAP